jgi:hypothetical protein
MATPLDYRVLTARELATELGQGEIIASCAIEGATVYDLETSGRHRLLVALADGHGLAIEARLPAAQRRKADAAA